MNKKLKELNQWLKASRNIMKGKDIWKVVGFGAKDYFNNIIVTLSNKYSECEVAYIFLDSYRRYVLVSINGRYNIIPTTNGAEKLISSVTNENREDTLVSLSEVIPHFKAYAEEKQHKAGVNMPGIIKP